MGRYVTKQEYETHSQGKVNSITYAPPYGGFGVRMKGRLSRLTPTLQVGDMPFHGMPYIKNDTKLENPPPYGDFEV